MNVILFVLNGCLSPALQPTSSRVAQTLGLFEMASWLARTSAWGWLCRLNVSLDTLWLEKPRSHACTESAGTGITHSRVVKVTQKVVPWPVSLWFIGLFGEHIQFAEAFPFFSVIAVSFLRKGHTYFESDNQSICERYVPTFFSFNKKWHIF